MLEHEDETKNVFKVTKTGKNIIHSVNANRSRNLYRTYKKHSPRFFIIHKDSSGTELLRYEDIKDYLTETEVDPMSAIIRDNLQGYPNIVGTTVLRPIQSMHSKYIYVFVYFYALLNYEFHVIQRLFN